MIPRKGICRVTSRLLQLSPMSTQAKCMLMHAKSAASIYRDVAGWTVKLVTRGSHIFRDFKSDGLQPI